MWTYLPMIKENNSHVLIIWIDIKYVDANGFDLERQKRLTGSEKYAFS